MEHKSRTRIDTTLEQDLCRFLHDLKALDGIKINAIIEAALKEFLNGEKSNQRLAELKMQLEDMRPKNRI